MPHAVGASAAGRSGFKLRRGLEAPAITGGTPGRLHPRSTTNRAERYGPVAENLGCGRAWNRESAKGEHSAFAVPTGALAGRFGRRSFTKRRIPLHPLVGGAPTTHAARPLFLVAFCMVHGATCPFSAASISHEGARQMGDTTGDTAANVPVRRKQTQQEMLPRPARSAVPVRHQIPQFRHLLNSRPWSKSIGGHGGAANHAEMAPPSRQFPPGRHIPKPSRTVEAC